MFGCGADITIWSREKDEVTKKETFRRVEVPVKCRWRRQSERGISGTGASVIDTVAVTIPYFTGLDEIAVKTGDIITLGKAHEINLMNPVEAVKVTKVIKVMKVAYNYGAEHSDNDNMRGKHLRIEGNVNIS